MDPLAELRFAIQVVEDARRTVLCPPELADQVRAFLAETGASGLFDIEESPYVPANQVIVVDHNAIEASTRQAMQRVRYRL